MHVVVLNESTNMAFMLSPLLKRYTEQRTAVLRAYFYCALWNHSVSVVAG